MLKDLDIPASLSVQVNKIVLPNGITVLVDSDSRFNSVAFAVNLVGGVRTESIEHVGITHMLEHLLFKRTKRKSPKDIARRIDELGGEVNAFTDHESLCLHGMVPRGGLAGLMELFAELLNENSFTEKDLELEREVIKQEIAEAECDPVNGIYQRFSQSFWPQSILGLPVYGIADKLERLTIVDLQRRLQEIEQGTRLVIGAAGAAQADELVRFAEQAFSHWPKGAREAYTAPVNGCGVETLPRTMSQAHLILGRKWPAPKEDDFLAGLVFATLFGDGASSRLFQLLREEEGLAYDVDAEVEAYTDTAGLVIGVAVDRSNLSRAAELILGEFDKVREDPFSQSEIGQAVKMHTAQLLLESDSLGERLSRAMETEVLYGRYVSPAETLAKLARLDRADFSALVERWLVPGQQLLVYGGDVEGYEPK